MPLCPRCERSLTGAEPVHASSPGVAELWCAAPYEGVARELAVALKFRRRLSLAGRAAEAIALGAPPGLLEGALVPVPPSPWRARVRGLDPAEEIAIALARVSGVPLQPCLARAEGPRQVGRGRAARLADPPTVRAAAAAPPHAVLVDDVVTTGATLEACAEALRRVGTERVAAVALARSEPGRPRASHRSPLGLSS